MNEEIIKQLMAAIDAKETKLVPVKGSIKCPMCDIGIAIKIYNAIWSRWHSNYKTTTYRCIACQAKIQCRVPHATTANEEPDRIYEATQS